MNQLVNRADRLDMSRGSPSSHFSLLAAEPDVRRPAVFGHGSHLACFWVELDQQLPRQVVAKPLDPAVGPRQDEEPLGSCRART